MREAAAAASLQLMLQLRRAVFAFHHRRGYKFRWMKDQSNRILDFTTLHLHYGVKIQSAQLPTFLAAA